MPLDPITALGLASNIIQFMDFSWRLLNDAHEIYHSSTGVTSQNTEIATIAEDLSRLSEKLTGPKPNSPAEEKIWHIANSSKLVADDLLSAVLVLKRSDKKSRRWRSFRQALDGFWNKDKIIRLQNQLKELRSQLSIHIIEYISTRQTSILRTLGTLQDLWAEIDSNQRQRITPLIEELQTLVQHGQEINESQLNEINDKLGRCFDETKRFDREYTILKSLHFENMSARQSSIVEAHSKTFDWIYEPRRWPSSDPRSQIKFHHWLRHGEGIYWISGKPGSGKSTLMKYLGQSERTKHFLQDWANGARLVISKFYFWIAGTELQKSQQGLLRQLLFEIFSGFPDLIPVMCSKRWESAGGSGSSLPLSWSHNELLEVFNRFEDAKLQALSTSKIFFFIDGLDEYNGDHFELIRTIQTITKLKNVKLCVSSRPWNCFEDAFGQDPRHKLYLQDLTKDDIAKYAREKLQELPGWNILKGSHSRYQQIVHDIVQRAQGVFLWVFLVIRSLREGLANGDSIALLHERLLELPSDLEEFFERLIKSVDRVYQKRMSVTFQVALQAHEPLRLIVYSILDEEQNAATQYPIRPLKSDVLKFDGFQEKEKNMHRQLNGRYKGLLEAPGFPKHKKVDFLHRTVRDFLATKGMQDLFDSQCGRSFDANLCVCQALVTQARVYPQSMSNGDLRTFMIFARNLEIANGRTDLRLLDEMDYFYYNIRGQSRLSAHEDFLEKAIQFGLASYIEHVIMRNPYFAHIDDGKALTIALEPFLMLPDPKSVLKTSRKMLDLVLVHGVHPNQRRNDSTIFRTFLDSYPFTAIEKDEEEAALHFRIFNQSLSLLLRRGADMRQAFQGGNCWFSNVLNYIGSFQRNLQLIRGIPETFHVFLENGMDIRNIRGLWSSLLFVTLTSQTNHGINGSLCFEMMKLLLENGANPKRIIKCHGERIEGHGEPIDEALHSVATIIDFVFEEDMRRELNVVLGRAIRKERKLNQDDTRHGLSRKHRLDDVVYHDDTYRKRAKSSIRTHEAELSGENDLHNGRHN
ncbi:hypothetical protein BGW36DRAFT_456579 [Talaromyces proteolyticus]|uniref:NACHT domain-containing protein n=1 Tax=Talaromyces proteolyticus TaxID=1131652 RepID=A0AAD4L4T2_9EURO|nr:uncharacterized protein BGW36DRAFT_456579 [Talaromyces proteolyticus]KAH8705046.1 hypothetical protein BGW36DRAFT_456579 [Talaromyces proteolyticus]